MSKKPKNRIKQGRPLDRWQRTGGDPQSGHLRVIGGALRGRSIVYSGDPTTRPMKDNIREAVFNLIGAWVPGTIALDLFAGSGALGIEALSRGAHRAIFIERHFPTARLIDDNLRSLELSARAQLETGDTFFWARQFIKSPAADPARPWLVFCSPPYRLYLDQAEEMLELIRGLIAVAPASSLFVVESDERFDSSALPDATQWRIRQYAPARIHIRRPGAFDD